MSWIRGVALPVILNLVVVQTAAASVISTFEVDTEGWGSTAPSVFEQRSPGGNPGGFLFIDNSEGPIEVIFAPAKFLGDLSAFDGGLLRFDGNMLGTGGTPFFGTDNYGTVTINGVAGSAKLDLVPDLPTAGTWTTYSAPLTAAAWGKSQSDWDAILADVTTLSLSVEALFGDEMQGIDNFALVPEPATALLLGLGMIGLAVRGTR